MRGQRLYLGTLQWKENELKVVDWKSRKTMTMYGALHPKSDVDRFYVKRKEGGRSLMSVERCVREEENSSVCQGMRVQLVREMPVKVDKNKTCQWLSKSDFYLFLFHLYFTSVKLYNCNRNNPFYNIH